LGVGPACECRCANTSANQRHCDDPLVAVRTLALMGCAVDKVPAKAPEAPRRHGGLL
jgi:hypothetical protein